jgi:hypothetical protein
LGPANTQIGTYSFDLDFNGTDDVTVPIQALSMDAAYADLDFNSVFTLGIDSTLEHTTGSHLFTAMIPLGGDGNPHTLSIPLSARVTLTLFAGILTNPVTSGVYTLQVSFTSVDPDTDGADDGKGESPLGFIAQQVVSIVGSEICGDCTDEDGDTLPDLFDPDCAAAFSTLALKKGQLSLDPDPDEDKLSLSGIFTAASNVDPPTQGVTISLTDADGQLTCLAIPPGEGWKTNKKRTVWIFKNKRGDSLGDPEAEEKFNLQYNVKKGVFKVQVNVKEAELMSAEAGEIRTGISIGRQAFMNTQTWKAKAKGKRLVTP